MYFNRIHIFGLRICHWFEGFNGFLKVAHFVGEAFVLRFQIIYLSQLFLQFPFHVHHIVCFFFNLRPSILNFLLHFFQLLINLIVLDLYCVHLLLVLNLSLEALGMFAVEKFIVGKGFEFMLNWPYTLLNLKMLITLLNNHIFIFDTLYQ